MMKNKRTFSGRLLRGAAVTALSAVLFSALPVLKADAAAGKVTLSADGTLTLSGEVTKEQIWAYRENDAVKAVTAKKGTVLPADCSELFSSGYADSYYDEKEQEDMAIIHSYWKNAETVNLSQADASRVTDLSRMFAGYSHPWDEEDIYSSYKAINLHGLNTSNAVNMDSMFDRCRNLTALDLSGFDTSNVTEMRNMFDYCSNLTSLDLSSFDTSNVTNMRQMFNNCSNLTLLDLNGFDTSKVTDMSFMFFVCNNLTSLDLSGFDTSNVTDMSWMFSGCNNLTSLDLSGFDTSNVTNMSSMFSGCNNLTSLDLSGFDTSNVTSMSSMFSGCNNLNLLDLSGFDTSKVTYMGLMFRDCSYLTAIHVSDRWDTSSLTHGYYKTPGYEMFTGCRNLKGGNGTRYSSNNTDAAYARIDKAGQPGYLTKAIITVQPKSTAAAEGSDAVFTLTASGSGLTYQWQYYHEGKAVWAASGQPGADTPTLTVAATPARNGQKYRCIVKQPNGKKTVSRTVVLTVYGEGEITAQPQSVTLDHLGETVAFRVVAWGRNPAYQWQVNTGTGWRNSVLDGCRTDTLSVEAKKYRGGYQYRCVITSLNGQTVSEPATLSFEKLAILRQPVSQSVMYGQTAQLQISARGTDLRYQWQYNFGSGWRNATAEGCNTDTMPVFAYRYRDGYRYRCVVTAYDGRIVSDEVTLRASQIQIVKQPEDVNLTWYTPDDWDEYGFMSVSATGTNLYYQWQKNDGSGWKNTGASSPSLKVRYEYGQWGVKYRCIVKPDKDSDYFAVTSDVAYLFCDSAGMYYDDY